MLNSKKKEFLYAASVFGPNLIFAMIMAYFSSAVNPAAMVVDAPSWAWLPIGATAAVAIIVPLAFGIFYTVGRVFDGLIDIPIAARLDKIKNRYARIRIPILIAFVPMVLGALGMTMPLFRGSYGMTEMPAGQAWGNTIWFFASSILFFAASTICVVTFMSSLSYVCASRKQRARVAFFKSFIDTVQFALAYALAPVFTQIFEVNIMIVTAFLIPTMISIFIPVLMTIGARKRAGLTPLVVEQEPSAPPREVMPAEPITDDVMLMQPAFAEVGVAPSVANESASNAAIATSGNSTAVVENSETQNPGGIKGIFKDAAAEPEDAGVKPMGLKKGVGALFKNKAFFPWLVVIFFTFLGLMLFLGAQNALVSGVLQLGVAWTIVLNSAAFGPVPIMLLLYNKMLKRRGIRFAYQVCLICFGLGIACFSLGSAYFFPNSEFPRILINLVGATLSSFAIGAFFMMNALIPAQISAIEKKITKRNNAAMYFAGQSVAIGIAVAIAGGLIWNVGLVNMGDWFMPSTVYGAGFHGTYCYFTGDPFTYQGSMLTYYGNRVVGFNEGIMRIPIGGFIAPFIVAVLSFVAFGFTWLMPKRYDAKTIGKFFDPNYVPDAQDIADSELSEKVNEKYKHIRGYDCLDGHFGLSMFLVCIPGISMLLGGITRLKRKQIIFGVLTLVLPPLFYIADIISMAKEKRLDWLAYDTPPPENIFKEDAIPALATANAADSNGEVS